MDPSDPFLEQTVDLVLGTLPPVWDRIRSNLRAAAIENFGITLEQFHILRHIRWGSHSVGELAEKKQISRSAVSQAVEVLVAKGLVTRQQSSQDRRQVHLALTPYASEVLDANFQKNRIWMKEKMAGLTPAEMDLIQQAMKILISTFSPKEA